jgi:hypothetical protein
MADYCIDPRQGVQNAFDQRSGKLLDLSVFICVNPWLNAFFRFILLYREPMV